MLHVIALWKIVLCLFMSRAWMTPGENTPKDMSSFMSSTPACMRYREKERHFELVANQQDARNERHAMRYIQPISTLHITFHSKQCHYIPFKPQSLENTNAES